MNIGINTFLFRSPFTDRSTKLFAQFACWGFDCVEIAVEQSHHINPAHVKRELEKHGLKRGPVCAARRRSSRTPLITAGAEMNRARHSHV